MKQSVGSGRVATTMVSVFSIGFEVDVESWEVDVTEAKCQ